MVIMSSKVDRLHTARRFCQLYAGELRSLVGEEGQSQGPGGGGVESPAASGPGLASPRNGALENEEGVSMSVWHTHRWKEHARTWAPPSGGGFRRADHLQGVVGRVRAADVRRHHDSLSV